MNRWKTWAFRSQRIHNGARRCGRIGVRFAGLDKLVHLIGLGEVVLRLGRGVAGAPSPACPGQRLEPQPRGAVTRRAVALSGLPLDAVCRGRHPKGALPVEPIAAPPQFQRAEADELLAQLDMVEVPGW